MPLAGTPTRCLAASRLLRAAAKRCLPFQPSALPPRTAVLPSPCAERCASAAAARGAGVRTRCSTPSTTSPAVSSQQHQDYYTITTPLYYVNAAPHMGSAYPTIAADVAARFQRLLGKRVRFLTGTDEHGEKIATAAAGRGLSPQAHCDDIASQYTDLWGKLDIRFDRFVRTTEPRHAALVVDVLSRCWDKGDIYAADYEGWYCVDCEEFKDEKEMVALPGPDGKPTAQACGCPTHRKPCQHRKEANYFFRLSKYSK
ncbi:Methionine--tRNA ligase [Tetrabaena socialis]|uniref:Methionine--tRNA ligase n=1 Tax=Tetrabaena socialis TaxID=47790 RepID=A0A2J8ABR1_9CHLO|nr:Methionine--tRNA ligase [Tetrabaena socialis]|eukprot:PNH09946.1 Methionine--tRNA ligase [Tetrabaena socialis]